MISFAHPCFSLFLFSALVCSGLQVGMQFCSSAGREITALVSGGTIDTFPHRVWSGRCALLLWLMDGWWLVDSDGCWLGMYIVCTGDTPFISGAVMDEEWSDILHTWGNWLNYARAGYTGSVPSLSSSDEMPQSPFYLLLSSLLSFHFLSLHGQRIHIWRWCLRLGVLGRAWSDHFMCKLDDVFVGCLSFVVFWKTCHMSPCRDLSLRLLLSCIAVWTALGVVVW